MGLCLIIKWPSYLQLCKPIIPYVSCPLGKKYSSYGISLDYEHATDWDFWERDSEVLVCMVDVIREQHL